MVGLLVIRVWYKQAELPGETSVTLSISYITWSMMCDNFVALMMGWQPTENNPCIKMVVLLILSWNFQIRATIYGSKKRDKFRKVPSPQWNGVPVDVGRRVIRHPTRVSEVAYERDQAIAFPGKVRVKFNNVVELCRTFNIIMIMNMSHEHKLTLSSPHVLRRFSASCTASCWKQTWRTKFKLPRKLLGTMQAIQLWLDGWKLYLLWTCLSLGPLQKP